MTHACDKIYIVNEYDWSPYRLDKVKKKSPPDIQGSRKIRENSNVHSKIKACTHKWQVIRKVKEGVIGKCSSHRLSFLYVECARNIVTESE